MGSTQVARDNAGRVTSAVDPQGHTSIMAYDTLNRVTRTQDAVGAVTTVVTNDPGHLRQVVDARGNVTTYYFDHLGRDTAIVDPNGARQRFVYDVRGNLSQRVNRRGQNTWFTYDSLGRVRTRLADGDTAVFSYDARSNATGVPTNGWMVARNPASKDSIAFDAMGRPDRLSTWRAGQLFNYTWVYDQLVTGQQQLTVRYPSGDSITAYVSYDNQFRIAGLLPDKRQATAFTYSAANLLQTITLPTSTTEAR